MKYHFALVTHYYSDSIKQQDNFHLKLIKTLSNLTQWVFHNLGTLKHQFQLSGIVKVTQVDVFLVFGYRYS